MAADGASDREGDERSAEMKGRNRENRTAKKKDLTQRRRGRSTEGTKQRRHRAEGWGGG